LPSTWLPFVFSTFEKNPKLVALSGPFIYYDLSAYARFLVRIFYGAGYIAYFIHRFILNNGSMLQGGNFIARRDALEKIGGFDTAITFYGEDTDIARRLHAIGPVKWTFGLPMYASGRRLAAEGIVQTGFRYAVNYFWTTHAKKPFTDSHKDIRTETQNRL
jgi:cellulose synthase/poly-beta-1,6-N-acetylglucosamine synthase-like glycosyltransferase